jgi:hypothetical protein
MNLIIAFFFKFFLWKISHSSFNKKERDKIENALLEEIEVLESDSNINLTLLEQKKAELENIRKEKLQGHIIKSRAKWMEEGENPVNISVL